MRARYWSCLAPLAGTVTLLITTAAARPSAGPITARTVNGQDQGATVREFTIVGDHYAFSPSTITVDRNDLVKITFSAKDIPHSFTIDSYRIAKRAAAGHTVTFEFRADQAGSVPFYCNLTVDPKCKDMKGTLIVR
ncbi:MAG TPA: cupredoxin domain-containing protein [Vicinamibacterales bacterium]|jgi:heme/copper-type cytochrome/quinol oxidase subunit 2